MTVTSFWAAFFHLHASNLVKVTILKIRTIGTDGLLCNQGFVLVMVDSCMTIHAATNEKYQF